MPLNVSAAKQILATLLLTASLTWLVLYSLFSIWGLSSFGSVSAPVSEIRAELGLAFTTAIPDPFLSSNSDVLQLYENGESLAPSDVAHDEIRTLGGGRHSFWEDTLYFSASDGTDPRANTRSYQVKVATKPPIEITWLACLSALFGLFYTRSWLLYKPAAWVAERLTSPVVEPRKSLRHRCLVLLGWASMLWLLAWGTHITVVAIFGTEAVDLMPPNPVGQYSYQVPIAPTRLQSFAQRHIWVSENGLKLGPANSLHENIGTVGRGSFSVWGNSLYFSAANNSDPRHNGKVYRLHMPVSPAWWHLGVASIALSLVLFGLRYKLWDWLERHGGNRQLLIYVGLTLTLILLQPWLFFTDFTGTYQDVYPYLVVVGLSLIFTPLSMKLLPYQVRVLLRSFSVLFAVSCLLRWYPEVSSYTGLDGWLAANNRFLGFLACVIGWWRPSLLLFGLCSSFWARDAFERAVGIPQPSVDEEPIIDMAIFLLVWLMLLFAARRHRQVEPEQQLSEATMGFYACLGIHFGNYFHSGIRKLGLDGPAGSWLIDNPTQVYLANAKDAASAPLDFFPNLFNWLYVLMSESQVIMNLITLATQLIGLIGSLLLSATPWIIVFYDVWHIAVGGLTGVFFWKWVVVNIAFFVALRKCPPDLPLLHRLLPFSLCILSIHFFSIFAAGWYDTPSLNSQKVYALTKTERVRVPPAHFLHYSFGAVSSAFWTPKVTSEMLPTSTFGSTDSHSLLLQSMSCLKTGGDQSPGGYYVSQLDALVVSLHQSALANAQHDGRPSLVGLLSYPHHIATNYGPFDEYLNLDLGTVTGYEFTLQPICTLRASLVEDKVLIKGKRISYRIGLLDEQ